MRILLLIALSAGCTTTEPEPTAPFVLEGADGVLGVGGRLFSSDRTVLLESTDVSVARLGDTPASIVGAGPGSAIVRGFNEDGKALGEIVVHVAPVTELRLVGLAEVLTAGTPVDVVLEPHVGDAVSSGTHYYNVLLDGEQYYCWGDVPRICNGPVFHDGFHLDGLPAGAHQLELRSVDTNAALVRQFVVE